MKERLPRFSVDDFTDQMASKRDATAKPYSSSSAKHSQMSASLKPPHFGTGQEDLDPRVTALEAPRHFR